MHSELMMAREQLKETPESQRTQRAQDAIDMLEKSLMDNGIDVGDEEAPSEEELAAMEAELVAAKQRVAKLPPAKRTHRAMEGIAALERDLQVARDAAVRLSRRERGSSEIQVLNLAQQGSRLGPPASSMSPAAAKRTMGASRGSDSSWHEDA